IIRSRESEGAATAGASTFPTCITSGVDIWYAMGWQPVRVEASAPNAIAARVGWRNDAAVMRLSLSPIPRSGGKCPRLRSWGRSGGGAREWQASQGGGAGGEAGATLRRAALRRVRGA